MSRITIYSQQFRTR